MWLHINDYFKSELLFYRPFEREDLQTYVKMCNEDSRRKWWTEAANAAVEWGLAQLRKLGAQPKIVGKAEHKIGLLAECLKKPDSVLYLLSNI